jgi:peptide/nickel transport system permease protein
MSTAVFVEGAMSFLGLGVVPPTASLGSLINEGAAYAWHAPFYAVGPLSVVVVLTVGLLLISQALSRSTRKEVPA